ncbi:MAG: GatB/YqeY domain-containing protein [Candidatus Dojkabacteria bacterium]
MGPNEMMDKLRKEMFEATKNKDQLITGITQMAMAAIKNAQIASDKELTPTQVTDVLRKEAKKLQDGIDQFQKAGREDLVADYSKQLDYLSQYLPQLMDEGQIREVVKAKIAALGITSVRDMGKLMGAVMGELQGKADGAVVKQVVSSELS